MAGFSLTRDRRRVRRLTRNPPGERDTISEIATIAAAAGIGAGVMYFFDPARGRRRRRLIKDQLVHRGHVLADTAGTMKRDLANHARGAVAVIRRPFRHEDVDDAILVERVRSELGRASSHPGAIDVTVTGGVVELSGDVLEREASDIIECVTGVRGVRGVDDNLRRRENAAGNPALQGNARTPERRFELLQENWTPAARLMTGLVATSLIGQAMRHRRAHVGDALMGLAGLGLLTRAVTNLPFDRLTGIGAGRRAITIRKSITIGAPVDEVYQWLLAWERWPEWMSHVREVTVSAGQDAGGQRTHWVVDGPAGTEVAWDAVVTRTEPDELIAWKTIDGSPVRHAGRIRLVPEGDRATRIDVQMSYNPVLGAAGHAVAVLLGRDPERQLTDDLARLKTTIETGTPPHDASAKTGADLTHSEVDYPAS